MRMPVASYVFIAGLIFHFAAYGGRPRPGDAGSERDPLRADARP
jgi:hypothetical protein